MGSSDHRNPQITRIQKEVLGNGANTSKYALLAQCSSSRAEVAQGWKRNAIASQEPASVRRGCSEQELMSLDKHKTILRGCVFPHHSLGGLVLQTVQVHLHRASSAAAAY